jgi:hypothetical protein
MRKKLLILAILFLAITSLCAWHFQFFPFKAPFARIPVKFTSSLTPYTEIEIEKKKYYLIVDLGSDSELGIKTEVLEKIGKKFLGKTHWYDIKGKEYESSRYQIPKMKIGKVQINNAKAHDGYTAEAGHIWGEKKYAEDEISGTFGKSLLGISRHLLLDLNNSAFFIFRKREDLKHLRKEGYLLENLVELPFDGAKNRVVFLVDTDMGQKRFLLDTGASISIIRPTFITAEERDEMQHSRMTITFSKFVIAGHDFGEIDLHAYDVPDKFEDVDGFLGMDFCKKHVIYLDFTENKALIGPAEKVHPVSQ